MNHHMTRIAANSHPAQGGGEHLSEHTSNVRERGRAGANAVMTRSGDR